MPLHLDYRPKNFDEVIGNKGVVESLKIIFAREADYPHSILFQGPTGCGKTTLARIVKDLLICLGQDFVEINASNNRGIDTARQIMEAMKFKPMVPGSKSRVFLIDEVHQVTGDFQNALLKALEDTPAHVYFLLCTTDPGKLLATIKNRCMIFEVQALRDGEIKNLLEWVLNEEDYKGFSSEVIRQIVEVAEGCPRQALVILDQVIDLPSYEKMTAAIQDLRVADKNTADLCKALLAGQSWKRINVILKQMDLNNSEMIRRAVIGWMATEVMKGDNSQAAMVYDCFKDPFYNTGKSGLIMACYQAYVLSSPIDEIENDKNSIQRRGKQTVQRKDKDDDIPF